MSNTQRTMALLKKDGMMCQVVEKWVKFKGGGGVRKDLFGIIDVLAISEERGILGVQVCSMSGRTDHIKKITIVKRDETRAWLCSGGDLELHSWRKLKVKRGGKAMRWTPDITNITIDMLGE